MIINIPLQVDEQKMEEVIAKDYEQKVLKEIASYIKAAISKYSASPYGDKVLYGMDELIKLQINNFLSDHKDEIIDSAAKALAERLARTKKAKELVNG